MSNIVQMRFLNYISKDSTVKKQTLVQVIALPEHTKQQYLNRWLSS